jgi:hypothetical protein
MQALLASLSASTAAARARREAIDRYQYRRSAYRSYQRRIDDSLGKVDDVTGTIGAVRDFARLGTTRTAKAERRVSGIEVGLLPVSPPAELAAAHDLFVSSVRLMREALRLYRGAEGTGDAAAVRNASAAAAGALLLLETARTRIGEFFRKPAAP